MKIHVLDLRFQHVSQTIAAYLIAGPAGYVLVETGPESTRPTLLQRLAEHGLQPADIRHVLVTHIHLDHAGCAGWWAQQGATVYVHHVGAPHLIDPSRLLSSASRIYGDQMDSMWGMVRPAPAENVISVVDGQTISAAGLTFTAIDTPGHAGHHHVYRLGEIAFTGDATGVRLPDSQWISLTAPPPEFNQELWLSTLDKIEKEQFQAIYPTHFGRVDEVSAHLAQFRTFLVSATQFIKEAVEAGLDRDMILARYQQWNQQQAALHSVSEARFQFYETANPLYMSVDGMMRYWRKKGSLGN